MVVTIPTHKKDCSNCPGITLISLLGKVCAKCLEKRPCEIVETHSVVFVPVVAQWIEF